VCKILNFEDVGHGEICHSYLVIEGASIFEINSWYGAVRAFLQGDILRDRCKEACLQLGTLHFT
jgi:hypothetical protein